MCSSVELDKIGNCLRNGRQKWRSCSFSDDHWIRSCDNRKGGPRLVLPASGSSHCEPCWYRAMEAHHQILAGDLYNHELCNLDNFPLTSLMFPFHMVVGHYWLPRIPCNSWLFTPIRALVELFSDFPDLSNPPSQTFLFQSLP